MKMNEHLHDDELEAVVGGTGTGTAPSFETCCAAAREFKDVQDNLGDYSVVCNTLDYQSLGSIIEKSLQIATKNADVSGLLNDIQNLINGLTTQINKTTQKPFNAKKEAQRVFDRYLAVV